MSAADEIINLNITCVDKKTGREVYSGPLGELHEHLCDKYKSLYWDWNLLNKQTDLQYTDHDGNVIGESISCPIYLNIKEGDTIYVEGAPSPDPISVNFMDEDGDVVTIQAKPETLLSQLFEQYSVQESISLLLSQIIFHYSKQDGEPLPTTCGNTLMYLEIESGDTIYVKRKLYDTEGLDNIQIPKVNKHPPESFIKQKIWTNEAIGLIVDVTHDTESGTVWIVEMQEGYKKRIKCMEEDIAEGMQLYYTAHDGLEKDFANYLLHIMRKQQADMEQFLSQLKRQRNEYDDLFGVLKLEQEINRSLEFDLHIEPWISTEMGVYVMRQSVDNLRDFLSVLSKLKKEILVKSKSTKVSKSIKEAGEAVYVTSKEGVPKRGMIKACNEDEDIDGYGPRRIYNILFDSGDLVQDVEDYQVVSMHEYTLSKRIQESEWKGVKHVCDGDSNDPWARAVGWYTVEIEGVEEAFEHCQTALMAYDINQAQIKGDDLKESDLNLPKDWSIYFKARASGKSKDLQMYGATVKDQIPLTACLFASYKRIQNPTMKRIWAALVLSSEPNTMLQGFNLGFMYKCAYINYLDGNLTKLKESLYIFALWHICIQNHINTQRICRLFIAAKGNLDDFLSMVPLLRKVYVSTASAEYMLKYLQANKPESRDDSIPQDEYMIIQCTNGYTTERNTVCCNAPLKQFLTRYADDRVTSMKSLRVKYKDRTLFLSSIGKKTPLDLGIKEDDILEITIISTQTETTSKEQLKQQSSNGKNKKKNNKKKHKKSKKKRPQPLVIQKTEAELRGEHSKLLGKVYEEAESQFKEIRQRLNALNLERTKPKQRTSPSKATAKPVEVVDNPLGDDQLGGKAGKTQFIIQVGEVSNLYKTTKPSSAGRGRRQDDIMIDLHGLTAEEAVYQLDKHLPSWIETAMKGTYPFVIPVKIVCGGGSQILAEVVENWIKQNDHVANAPKNMY